MTDNTSSIESLHLDQPLLSPQQQATENLNNGGDTTRTNQTNNFDNGSIFNVGGPRILDRDGTFSQSRGRWRVSNTRKRHVATSVNGVTNDDEPPAFVATSSSRHPPHGTTNNSLFQRLYNRLACCYTSRQQYRNPSLTRRCWDDWFHTLSYTPTLILMLGVFAAYFVTIVLFAGLYLTVNKVGEHYSNGNGIDPNGMEVDTAEMMGDGVSFCGMDINNHMEGECV